MSAVTKFLVENPGLAKAMVIGILALSAAMVALNAVDGDHRRGHRADHPDDGRDRCRDRGRRSPSRSCSGRTGTPSPRRSPAGVGLDQSRRGRRVQPLCRHDHRPWAAQEHHHQRRERRSGAITITRGTRSSRDQRRASGTRPTVIASVLNGIVSPSARAVGTIQSVIAGGGTRSRSVTSSIWNAIRSRPSATSSATSGA